MIVETATFEILSGESERFETVFAAVGRMLAGSPGYSGHRLLRDANECDRYLLIVDWRDGGVNGFRQAGRLDEVCALLEPLSRRSPSLSYLSDVNAGTGVANPVPLKLLYAD